MAEPLHVDVVVTHYDDPTRLAWVLDALAAQTYPAEHLSVIVADDGSPILPDVPAGVRVVTQPDEGFRAAAARNLGARQGNGELIVFLDGDTLPEPDYVRSLVDALVAGRREADSDPPCDGGGDEASLGMLLVGRRRHADLTALARMSPHPSSSTRTSLTGMSTNLIVAAMDSPLGEPRWLSDGYNRTANLRHAGPHDWRFVISAVMAMTRQEFEALGGFDETIVGYGGEDWDLAYRAWNTGVALRHVPGAVAWHDGPDAGARPGLAAAKEREHLALAARIPQPLTRGRNAHWPVPRVLVTLGFADADAIAPSTMFAVVESWLALGDVIVSVPDKATLAVFDGDRRVVGQPVDLAPLTLDCVEFVVEVTEPVALLDAARVLDEASDAPRRGRGVRVSRTRHSRLGLPDRPLVDGVVTPTPFDSPLDLERWGRERWS